MKFLAPALALVSLTTVVACGGNASTDCVKAEFEVEPDTTLDVFLQGDLAYVDCPYTCELPTELTDEDVVNELDGPSALSILNVDTGVSVNLTQAMAPGLGDPPGGPGEWSIEVDRDAGNVRLWVYNDLGTGQRLRVGTSYTSTFSLGPNTAVEEIPDTTITLNVQDAP